MYGELGPIYGKQWRSWEGLNSNTDQIQNLINELKTNPDSRRLMVNAWNVGELRNMTLPPCHYGFQVYTRELSLREKCDWLNKNYPMYELGELTVEKISDSSYLKEVEFEYNIPIRAISLMWNQRSVDTFLGLPFNIASYALLLEIIAREVNMIPDQLIGNLGDTHLYLNHIEQAKEQLTREPMPLSELVINDEFWNPDVSFIEQIEHIQPTDFFIKNYQSHPAIKAPLSN
jgi:thymidylate synthase